MRTRNIVIEVREWAGSGFWEARILLPNGHSRYRLVSKDKYPDELSAYMAVVRELEKEEQTDGTRT